MKTVKENNIKAHGQLAKNEIIKAKTAADIDQRIERVLRDLGNPEPPLNLETVRGLLKLDLAFYTADDPSLLQEVVSKMTMAGKQVLARPSRILAQLESGIYAPSIFQMANAF